MEDKYRISASCAFSGRGQALVQRSPWIPGTNAEYCAQIWLCATILDPTSLVFRFGSSLQVAVQARSTSECIFLLFWFACFHVALKFQ